MVGRGGGEYGGDSCAVLGMKYGYKLLKAVRIPGR